MTGPLPEPGAPDSAATRTALEAARRTLLEQVRALGEPDPGEAANLQFGKRIGDGTGYAIERMTGAFQAKTLYRTISQIEAALERLDSGRYGRCERCGIAIPAERLAAVPWAGLCGGCASLSQPYTDRR